jgi:hypothetical protein
VLACCVYDDPPDHCLSWDLKGKCGGLFLSGRSARGGREEEEDGIGSGRTSWSRPLCGGVVGLCVCACVATRLAGSIGTREKQIAWRASRRA